MRSKFMFLLILCLAARGISAEPDAKALAQLFRQTFGEQHELVSDRIAHDEYDRPWWLVEARPKQPGFYAFRIEADFQSSSQDDHTNHVRYEYFVDVGRAGESRTVTPTDSFPMCCVGDTFVLPVDMRAGLSSYQFYSTAFEDRVSNIYKEYYQSQKVDLAAKGKEKEEIEKSRVTLADPVAAVFELIATQSGSAVTRSMQFEHFQLACALRAHAAGNLNLQISADGVAKKDNLYPLCVVAKDQPISILVDKANTTEFGPHHTESGTAMAKLSPKSEGLSTMRVGDQVNLLLWGARLPVGEQPVLPQLRLEALPFDASSRLQWTETKSARD